MAKIRKVPRTYQAQAGQPTRAIPAQYTTDPDVATPEQVRALGLAADKGKILREGKLVSTPMVKETPLVNALVGIDTDIGNAPGSVRKQKNKKLRGSGSIKTGATFADLNAPETGIDMQPFIVGDIDQLPEQARAALMMAQSSLAMRSIHPEENDEYVLYRQMLTRRNNMESEQSRLKAMFRRFDNLYHPTVMTAGGADHWPEDPSARLAGRVHISVNVHPSYVNIPASLQAVRPVINYVPSGTDKEARMLATERERLFFRWWEENDMDLLLQDACTLKSLYGHTAAKIYWDPIAKLPRISIIEAPENLYIGFGSSDFRRIDWALYVYGLSPQAAMEEFGIATIPVRDGGKMHLYTSSTTHEDPLANVYRNNLERNPQRNRSQYELQQVEVYDYWYKKPQGPGKPSIVCNAIFVGNTMVKNEEHPEYGGTIPYLVLQNSRIPGSPYGKPELYDVEQLLREKDERMSAQAQMIASTVGGQMWQLVGPEAPDEVPPNAIPKPNRIATPGPGNEIRSISPFIPEFQVEDFNRRLDREIAVVTGLNDLLLGLAPSSVLGSSRAIASLVANYEQRIAPKRALFYTWIKQVWEMTGRLWSEKDGDVQFILANEFRLEITPPELTPRDTLELAQTAINLVQNRVWSAERAMDRVGVDDPEGEKDVIRSEQTDATLNPAAVMTMANLMSQFQQLQMQGAQMQQLQQQQQAQAVPPNAQAQFAAQQASAQNAFMSLNPPAAATSNAPELQANPPQESLPANAQAGAELLPPEGAAQ